MRQAVPTGVDNYRRKRADTPLARRHHWIISAGLRLARVHVRGATWEVRTGHHSRTAPVCRFRPPIMKLRFLACLIFAVTAAGLAASTDGEDLRKLSDDFDSAVARQDL